MAAAAAQKQKAVDLSQQQNTYVNTTVEDLGAAYFAENPLYSVNLKTDLSQFEFGSSTNSGFTINQDIMNGVGMPSIVHSDYQLDSGLASGNGLTLEQVRKASLQMITHWDQPLMLPAYDPNFELTGGAKLMPTSAANQAYQRDLLDRQQAFFGGGRPEAWHMPVSQGIVDSGFIATAALAPGAYIASQSVYSLANSESVWQGVEMMSEAGFNARFAVAGKNRDGSEIKAFLGSDISGISGKGEYLLQSYKKQGLNYFGDRNVSARLVTDDLFSIFDASSYQADFVREIDLKPIAISNKQKLTGTFGTRQNLSNGSTSASFNLKKELPYNIFGWTPSISLELRGGK